MCVYVCVWWGGRGVRIAPPPHAAGPSPARLPAPRSGSGSKTNENWNVTASYIQSLENPGLKCLRAGYPGDAPAIGAKITTADCNPADPAQALAFSAATGLITHAASGLCVDAGSIVPIEPWCQNAARSSWTVCNMAAGIDARAADIVSRLSLADKILALNTDQHTLTSVGLPAYNWWSEATHGISHVTYSTQAPWASNTALPITTSCAFNRSLWEATGNQIGREARAFMNLGTAYSTYWAPVVRGVGGARARRALACDGGSAQPDAPPPPPVLSLASAHPTDQHRARPAVGPQPRVRGRGPAAERAVRRVLCAG